MAKSTKTILIAGVDEAGRGPLAGPVIAAAVILDPNRPIEGLNDSKLLTAKKREQLAILIRDHSLAWAIGRAEVDEIDRINIFQATMLAMQRAVESLSVEPEEVMVDGNFCPPLKYKATAVVKGDQLIQAISAASILAKVTRDNIMVELEAKYPGYGFAQHKGYSTEMHLTNLKSLGPSEVHRRSFEPVYSLLPQES